MRSLQVFLLIFLVFALSSCQKEDITQSGMANDRFFLESDGQKMPIFVAGNLDSDKMILIIHGGPGGNSIVYRDDYVIENVEKEFAVVYWDQRFAGGSQGSSSITDISAFRSDIKKLIYLLRSLYGQNKQIYLFAHSWGGFLAPYFLIENSNQQMVDGWIQIGGAHNFYLNDSLTQQMLLFYGRQEVLADRNVKSWEKIVAFCDTANYVHIKNAFKLNEYAHEAEGLMPDVLYPNYTFKELFDWYFLNDVPLIATFINGIASGIFKVYEPAYITEISDYLSRIEIPALLLWGKYDFVCPPGLMDDIKENIGSDDVSEYIFQNSGHSPMMNQPELFWQVVIDWIKTH
jgi:pimeloyl-ACP methyl ester carboxylesterase